MKRRDFLVCALSLAPAASFSKQQSDRRNENDAAINQVDVIVAGGSIKGCMAALQAAESGARVLVIESRSYLGSEITAALRPWIQKESVSAIAQSPLGDVFTSSLGDIGFNDEKSLRVGALKKGLLRILSENGVQVLFQSQPAGVLIHQEETVGLAVTNKAGLQAIPAKVVIDATDNKCVSYFAGIKRRDMGFDIPVSRTLEFINVNIPKENTVSASKVLGLQNNEVIVHPGSLDESHCYVEFSFKGAVKTVNEGAMLWERQARLKSIRLCEYLIRSKKAFEKAVLLQTSPEVKHAPFVIISGIDVNTHESDSVKNLFVFNAVYNSRQRDKESFELWDRDARRIGSFAAKRSKEIKNTIIGRRSVLSLGFYIDDFSSFKPQLEYDRRLDLSFYNLTDFPLKNIPVCDESEVLIVGGGTSGASAAISACEQSCKTTLIEPLSGLGGTGAIGGINTYYHGYRGGFTAELDKKVLAMNKRISTEKTSPSWHIEAKMMTFFEEIVKMEGNVFFQTQAVNTILEGRRVLGVVASTPDGLRLFKAKVTIDATGDGDLAAWSGVRTHMGSETDGDLQTCNQCDWRVRRKMDGVNIDLAVVDNRDPIDRTRGYYTGHRKNSDYDFSPYISVRESRHIEGDYTLQIEDVMTQRRFDDAIAIGKTDFDRHGMQSSPLARLGYLPYHCDEKIVRIPYRVCLPKNVDCLFVIGKAFSAQSDAFCFMRMQPDLQNMGCAIGLAASMAVKNDCPIRDIDIKVLQAQLQNMKIIREDDISDENYSIQSLPRLVRSLQQGDETMLLDILCAPKNEILPLLKEAFTSARDHALIAMALAWFGSDMGADVLIDELKTLKDAPQESELYSDGRPSGGFVGIPSTYWKVNQLIVLLGQAKAARAIDVLCEIVNNTDAGGLPQPHERLHWRRVPNYDRIISLAETLEKLADKKAIGPLESLLKKPYLSGHVSKNGFVSPPNYSSAYLELIIARALAKCGSHVGFQILEEYTKDQRTVLSAHAYRALHEK
ncbi:MAG: FAD-dependent oxidoreductase [Candidatus Omnitrophica bacterium]|nr:FAD-dependent oxidoreductase [Candidatus Omnitrophota bacterium]